MLDIRNDSRVRYFLPFTDAELQRLMSLMGRCVALEEVSIELSIVGDEDMAGINRDAMGCDGPTNILSFPLVYDSFSPYIPEKDDAPEEENPLLADNQARGDAQQRGRCQARVSRPPVEGSHMPGNVSASGNGPVTEKRPSSDDTRLEVAFSVRNPLLGALVIAPETIQREAFLYGQPLDEYTVFLLAHGFVHLLGYEHGPAMDALVERMHKGVLETVMESCPGSLS